MSDGSPRFYGDLARWWTLISPPEEYARLEQFIQGERCLSRFRGQLARRNACRNPWINNTNARFSKLFRTLRGQSVELTLDVTNLFHLFDSDWGNVRGIEATGLLGLVGYDPALGRGIYTLQIPHKRVLDAGCGSGRHSYYAAKYGADVWAVDLGQHVEVARRNTINCDRVHVIQADLHDLPFATESFDFIYSIGVLHHLPDPEAGFRSLLQYLKPGGEIQIYLYWEPEGQPIKTALLSAVAAIRKLTTRLPNAAIYSLSYPAAWLAFMFFVWPYRALRLIPQLRGLAERMPMKQYSNYPFRVCVNDQFDRFSAPIENRYTKAEVEEMLRRAGLKEINVQPNCSWGGSGKKV